MNVTDPFAYPAEPHRRRHGPAGYADYRDFKPWLRDEFVFRCVYCLSREKWYPNGSASFSIDHVVPKSVDPSLINEYHNLVYSCNQCNSIKRARITIDPTKTAFGEHLRVENNGRLSALSDEGNFLIYALDLNAILLVEERLFRRKLFNLYIEFGLNDPSFVELFSQSFSFPSDLPNLKSLRPPEGNSRSGSENDSHHARHARGELGQYY